MKRRQCIIAGAVVIAAIMTDRASQGQCKYAVAYKIPPVPCPWPWGPAPLSGQGIAQGDLIGGYRQKCFNLESGQIPLTWTPEGGLQLLPFPAGSDSAKAHGINSSGMIVGSVEFPTQGTTACIWKDGEIIIVPNIGGNPPYGEFESVNDAGLAVGWRTNRTYRAIWWQDGELNELDPAPFGFDESSGRGVSPNGWISGNVYTHSTCNGRAFRMRNGDIELLEPLPGGVSSSTGKRQSMTSRGWVLGETTFKLDPDQPCGALNFKLEFTLWTESEAIQIPPLPGYGRVICYGMNDQGVIVGQCRNPQESGLPPILGTIWVDAKPYPFPSLVVGEDGWQPQFSAHTIGDDGTLILGGPTPVVTWEGLIIASGTWLLKPVAPCEADVNGDCRVDSTDLLSVLACWGQDVTVADFNGDGTVNGADLARVLGNWTIDLPP